MAYFCFIEFPISAPINLKIGSDNDEAYSEFIKKYNEEYEIPIDSAINQSSKVKDEVKVEFNDMLLEVSYDRSGEPQLIIDERKWGAAQLILGNYLGNSETMDQLYHSKSVVLYEFLELNNL